MRSMDDPGAQRAGRTRFKNPLVRKVSRLRMSSDVLGSHEAWREVEHSSYDLVVEEAEKASSWRDISHFLHPEVWEAEDHPGRT